MEKRDYIYMYLYNTKHVFYVLYAYLNRSSDCDDIILV